MTQDVREETSWLQSVDPTFFFVSRAISVLFVIWGALFTDNLGRAVAALEFLISEFGWFYLLAATGLLVFSIRLGKDSRSSGTHRRASPLPSSSASSR